MASLPPDSSSQPQKARASLSVLVFEDTLRFSSYALGMALLTRFTRGSFEWTEKGKMLLAGATGSLLYHTLLKPNFSTMK